MTTTLYYGLSCSKHMVSHPGYIRYYGLLGLWQGSLDSGRHDIVIQSRNRRPTKNDSEYWQTRTLTIICC